MKAGVVVFPGTNRERDMAIALQAASGRRPRMVWHGETELAGLDLVVLPGGFSHGDYLRCGAMAARSPVMEAVRDFAAAGGYVLGVCNGFQILTEAGLLPGALLRNASLRFLSQDCHLRVERADTAFTRHYQTRRRCWTGWRAKGWSRCVTRAPRAPSCRRPIPTAPPAASPASSARMGGSWA